MTDLTKQIKDEIYGEILLFCSRANYTSEEKRLIIDAVDKRLNEQCNYIALIHPFVDKLSMICDNSQDMDEGKLQNSVHTIKLALLDWGKKDEQQKLYEIAGAYASTDRYFGKYWGELYTDIIKTKIIDVVAMKEAYDNNTAYENYMSNVKFLYTNNLLIKRYPMFYKEEYIEQLEEVATKKKMRDFACFQDYMEFRTLSRETLSNVDGWIKRNTPAKKIKKY